MNAYPTRDRLIKLRAVLEITGISKSSLYRKVSAGTFPPPVRQGLRAVAWRESEVLAWIAGLPTRTQKHGAHKGGRSANRSTGGEMNPGTPATPPTRAPLARRFRSTHNSRGRSDSSKKDAFRAVSPGITPTPLTEGLRGGRAGTGEDRYRHGKAQAVPSGMLGGVKRSSCRHMRRDRREQGDLGSDGPVIGLAPRPEGLLHEDPGKRRSLIIVFLVLVPSGGRKSSALELSLRAHIQSNEDLVRRHTAAVDDWDRQREGLGNGDAAPLVEQQL